MIECGEAPERIPSFIDILILIIVGYFNQGGGGIKVSAIIIGIDTVEVVKMNNFNRMNQLQQDER